MIRVLVVDDCVPTRTLLCQILDMAGCQVTAAESAEDALDMLNSAPVDVLVSDLVLPGRSGVWLVGEVAARGLAGRIVAASGGGDFGGMDGLEAARRAGAHRALPKPVPARTLIEAVTG